MNTICFICQSDKQLPSSFLEKLCCSSSIMNEPLITLNCCSQKCHKSCLNTYIISSRDVDGSVKNYKYTFYGEYPSNCIFHDPCPHCRKILDAKYSNEVKWGSLNEYNNHLAKNNSKTIYNRYSIIVPIILIIMFVIISPVIYRFYAQTRYVSLCINNNLTFHTGNFSKERACFECVMNNGGNDNYMDSQGVKCPFSHSLILIGSVPYYILSLYLTIAFMIPLVNILENMFEYLYKKFASHDIIYYAPTIWISFIWLIRIITITVYFKLILDPIDNINDFNEIYKLTLKYFLMDVVIGLIAVIPYIIYLMYNILYPFYKTLEALFHLCECGNCCHKCFHTSHHVVPGSNISTLSPNTKIHLKNMINNTNYKTINEQV